MQKELSDPIRNLDLSKNKAELPSSRLQQWNLLNKTVNVREFCSRQKHSEHFFTTEDELKWL
jgi:hypothetical protein